MSGAPLVVLEGIDGSGKGTQARRLREALEARGLRVGSLTFPQYEANRFGRLVGRFLNGEFGPLDAVAPELAALLFAGDRRESAPELARLRDACDVVLLDRYVASNVAHQASRVDGARRRTLVEFLDWLEHEHNGLPRPDATVWLDIPPDLARRRVAAKDARDYTEREADIQEDDPGHLAGAAAVYQSMAGDQGWVRVTAVEDGRERTADEIAADVLAAADAAL